LPGFAGIGDFQGVWTIPRPDRRRRPGRTEIRLAGENRSVELQRAAWLVTVAACLIAVVILVLEGYLGYAGVTFAVAVAAAVNI
jgi:hypothetical protein